MSKLKKIIIEMFPFVLKVYLFLKFEIGYLYSEMFYDKLNPKNYNKDNFIKIKTEALDQYLKSREIKREGKFEHKVWTDFLLHFDNFLIKKLDDKFLRNQSLLLHFGGGAGTLSDFHRKYIDYILDPGNKIINFIKAVFVESRVGFPLICKYHNLLLKRVSVEHLYYLTKIINQPNNTMEIKSVVELGGGIGGLAYVFKLFNPKITYIIVDFPGVHVIQHIYLKLNFMNVMINYGPNIVEGAVNLVSVTDIDKITYKPDIFVSNFALTETTNDFRKYIEDRKYFSAKYLYLTGGMDPVFNSHIEMQARLMKNFSGEIRSLDQSGCYEFFGINKS